MHSFSYKGLKKYLLELGEFNEVDVIVFESSSRCYQVHLRQVQDLERLTPKAIFNVDCQKVSEQVDA